jgi:hypothetical protein
MKRKTIIYKTLFLNGGKTRIDNVPHTKTRHINALERDGELIDLMVHYTTELEEGTLEMLADILEQCIMREIRQIDYLEVRR